MKLDKMNNLTFSKDVNEKYHELERGELMQLKAEVLNDGLHAEINKLKKYNYLLHLTEITGEVFKTTQRLTVAGVNKDFNELLSNESPLRVKVANNINNADRARAYRLKKRINDVVTSGNAVFVTLTFTDDVLNGTSQATRRRYVSRFLASQSNLYVANIDYGDVGGREHYHAVINGRVKPSAWSYGSANVIKIRTTADDVTRVAKYVSKLTNHAIKNSTKRPTMIYSRSR